ncbi:MAG TPA: O-antigen ligase family protein, partial [Vicinamibacterales bacterium]|nr:O-antigen ligase family protein [Vicinamibacterales bacterium]
TDPYPYAAFKRVLARTGFLLVPLSILYLKYFPSLGRVYNRWTWTSTNIGVSTDKNGLGALCLVFGLASVWRLLETGRDGEDRNHHVLLAHGAMLVMVTWLLLKADSSTSFACLVLGSIVLVLMRRPGTVRLLTANLIVSACAAAGVIALMFQNLYAYAVEGLGRNTTLTGRTDIWDDLFRMADRPLLGTGFESFWLGPRAEYLWNKYYFHPNQAHNGYIETYLNLGWAGVALLVIVIIWGYRNILGSDRGSAGSLCFALFLVALIYNLTEAAFKVMHPLWIAFLFAAAAWPALEERASA